MSSPHLLNKDLGTSPGLVTVPAIAGLIPNHFPVSAVDDQQEERTKTQWIAVVQSLCIRMSPQWLPQR